MKKLTYLISLLMPVSLILAACASTPTPAAAPTQAANESPTVMPTQVLGRADGSCLRGTRRRADRLSCRYRSHAGWHR